jgi:class 3 adenylate cyclase
MTEAQTLFAALRQSADPDVVSAIEALVREAPDNRLNRINALAFAAKTGLNEERVIAAFLHAARLGLFEMSWNVLCPGCGGVLDTGASLKTVNQAEYGCALCAAGYEPTLDEMVEVTFTVTPRTRRIAAHAPNDLPALQFYRQLFWSSGIDLEDDAFEKVIDEIALELVELPPGEKAMLSLTLPAEFVIVFDPVTHTAQFIDVKGDPVQERRSLSIVFNRAHAQTTTLVMQPGPLRLTLDNRTDARIVPGVFIAAQAMHDLLGHRQPFLTAKRLLSNQTFREIYRTSTLDIDQRLKITSLTFLFTDLKGSTDLYERVGDLVAFDIVKEHFRILQEIIAAESGAVVKTIGDAVMATFATPDRGLAAALRIREAMRAMNEQRQNDDLLLKIGIHEGPCLAVTLNDRQDYFGQTVNIASRVQCLAVSRSILATSSIVDHPLALELLEADGIKPTARRLPVRGIADEMAVYEIP